ncbi:uncharacterized protein [Magallana gigas]|uniref:uncharacterized protein n=1 Tax=Magallana gigas TaxID=29159 RepID=UPI003341EF3B
MGSTRQATVTGINAPIEEVKNAFFDPRYLNDRAPISEEDITDFARKLHQCLFGRITVEIDTLRKPLSTDADYYQVLRFIDHQLPESIALEGFIADFEVALWKALKDRFPGTPIQGCVFHWTQVVLGKSRSTDFRLPITRSTQSTSSCANSWPCHSILPPEHIEETFLRLDGRAPEVLAPVMDFVYRTWIRSSVFKIDHWSVFMTSIRMNNDVEG